MLKRILKTFIIAVFPLLLLAGLSIFIATVFLDSTEKINQWQAFFKDSKSVFLTLHILFYLALFFLWPSIIALSAKRQGKMIDERVRQLAMRGRLYLLSLFIIFEILYYLRF